jgi:hypothetical protein
LVEKIKYELNTTPGSSSKSQLLDPGVKENNLNNENMGNVFINETQYFANVPKNVWEFYIGGYQPAQKWLKDRK